MNPKILKKYLFQSQKEWVKNYNSFDSPPPVHLPRELDDKVYYLTGEKEKWLSDLDEWNIDGGEVPWWHPTANKNLNTVEQYERMAININIKRIPLITY
jgi:hypothetical protein